MGQKIDMSSLKKKKTMIGEENILVLFFDGLHDKMGGVVDEIQHKTESLDQMVAADL